MLTNSTFERLIRFDDYNYLQSKISKYGSSISLNAEATYGEYFTHVYKTLKTHYRNEYLYKNFNYLLSKSGKYYSSKWVCLGLTVNDTYCILLYV